MAVQDVLQPIVQLALLWLVFPTSIRIRLKLGYIALENKGNLNKSKYLLIPVLVVCHRLSSAMLNPSLASFPYHERKAT